MEQSSPPNALSADALSADVSAVDSIHQSTIDRLLDGETVWDQRLIHLGRYVNPILIKETRQALKSSQFTITFLLLIALTGVWTFFGIFSSIPEIYYVSNGQVLLNGYLFILIIPALIVVPLASFHSMASELDDGTFESISLSLLTPRRIVVGKLCVAMLQLGVYLSVVAPCIALTYLLRGLTLYGILAALLFIVTSSIISSATGITLATLSRSRGIQILFNIGFLLAQAFILFLTLSFFLAQTFGGMSNSLDQLQNSLIVIHWVGIPWTILMLTIACVRIGDASLNKSTPVRWAMLGLGLALATVGVFIHSPLVDAQFVATISLSMFIAIVWAFAGVFMVGEQGFISVRTMRELPNNLMSRMFLSWFIPGPGTGFVFSVLSLAGCLVVLWLISTAGLSSMSLDRLLNLAILFVVLWMYVTCHVGLAGLIAMSFSKTFGEWKMLSTLTVTLVLHFLVCIGTILYSGFLNQGYGQAYYSFCILNPYWTLSQILDRSMSGSFFSSVPEVWGILLPATLIIFLMNLALASRGIVIQRIETPERISQQRRSDRSGEPPAEEEFVHPLA